MSVVPRASSPRITARWVIDLSPGGRHTPRTRFAGAIRHTCTPYAIRVRGRDSYRKGARECAPRNQVRNYRACAPVGGRNGTFVRRNR